MRGIVAAARERTKGGRVVKLAVEQPVRVGAVFAYVILAGRTEAPAMDVLRRFVVERLRT